MITDSLALFVIAYNNLKKKINHNLLITLDLFKNKNKQKNSSKYAINLLILSCSSFIF